MNLTQQSITYKNLCAEKTRILCVILCVIKLLAHKNTCARTVGEAVRKTVDAGWCCIHGTSKLVLCVPRPLPASHGGPAVSPASLLKIISSQIRSPEGPAKGRVVTLDTFSSPRTCIFSFKVASKVNLMTFPDAWPTNTGKIQGNSHAHWKG